MVFWLDGAVILSPRSSKIFITFFLAQSASHVSSSSLHKPTFSLPNLFAMDSRINKQTNSQISAPS